MLLILSVVVLTCGSILAAEITIDPTQEFQTIEGFGAYGGSIKNWQQSLSPALANRLVDDMGLTISRGPLPFDFQNPDGSFNHSGDVAKWIPIWKALKQKRIHKFIISVWSPPVWMKNPGNHGHKEPWCQDGRAGGYLLPENYGKFAEMCLEFLRYFKHEVGVEVFALSLQNEPAFDEPYESCVYSPEQYAAILKVVGRRLREERLATRLVGPEDLGSHDRVMKYLNAVMEDPEARGYLGFVAVHGYAPNGITADSPDARIWQSLHAVGANDGKQLWMTETSGYDESWTGAMALARAMYTALRFGQVSGWCWWQAAGADNEKPTSFTLTAGPGGADAAPKFHVAACFGRFVRPGVVRTEAISDDASVLPLAFKNPEDKALTIVVINDSAEEKPLDLKGASIPSHGHLYRTSVDEKGADLGMVRSVGGIPLPAQSLSVLVFQTQP